MWYKILDVIDKKKPSYCLFENVNRLLQSPALEKGRDFAYMLASLNDRGYSVEWMVVDSSLYGFPQRRKRVFFFCFKSNTPIYKEFKKGNKLILEEAFPVIKDGKDSLHVKHSLGNKSLDSIFKEFNPSPKGTLSAFKYKSPKKFYSYGLNSNREYSTYDIKDSYSGKYKVLNDILEKEKNI